MRVYVPSTLPGLAVLHASGQLAPAPISASAVTPALREWYAAGDEEELEYAAMSAAARDSLRRLAAEAGAPPRRVVLAVEVPDADVTVCGEPRAAVVVGVPVPLRWVRAVHVDDGAAEPDVAAAVGSVSAADLGDEDAQFVVDGAVAHELAWFATQEIPLLLAPG